MAWKIIAEPQGANTAASASTAENKGGMVFFLQNDTYSSGKQEIGRVAFERKNSINPRVPYDKALDDVVAKCRKSIEVLNDLASGAGTLQ